MSDWAAVKPGPIKAAGEGTGEWGHLGCPQGDRGERGISGVLRGSSLSCAATLGVVRGGFGRADLPGVPVTPPERQGEGFDADRPAQNRSWVCRGERTEEPATLSRFNPAWRGVTGSLPLPWERTFRPVDIPRNDGKNVNYRVRVSEAAEGNSATAMVTVNKCADTPAGR
ncbi:hypothetical protein AAFF_G00282220 [Aldrovandia affinis]|uniref:Uncharacterized protein n=1 Tax=Aldrovandia affinis TaxID=143900 RepID=A0AAD7T9S3_9TELE|nr:hypothetical protein AAFF_G00282220 [Aldrovandia affinis]